MKREHNIDDLPFSENIVFYSPLTEGDLTDHVSGNSFSYTNYGSYEWSNSENAYRIVSPSSSPKVTLKIESHLDIPLTTDSEYTIFAKIKVNSLYSCVEPFIGIGNWDAATSFKPHINTSTNFIRNANEWSKCAYVGIDNDGDGRICRYYVSGNDEYNTYTHVSSPSQWTSSNKCGEMVCIGINRNGSPIEFYVRDVMIFNRVLTQEEINQL